MAVRKGKCTNFGNCTNADSRKVVIVPDGTDFLCPECTRQLNPVEETKTSTAAPIFAVVVILLLLVGGGWFAWSHWMHPRGPSAGTVGTITPPGVSVILRLHGSNTIGAQLGPSLAQAYFRKRGAQDAKIVAGNADEVSVQATVAGARQAIEVLAHGTATAFSDLAGNACDIGMASRRIATSEAASLSKLGDMMSAASEHVLGLDGVAVIVNRANPISSLSISQVAALFSGDAADWSPVSSGGGSRHPVKLYARDDKSGTFDTFKTLVLNGRNLSGSATRIEDSRQLSENVAADADGIGFVGLPYVDGSKAIAISEKGTRALFPNRLTVATEDYPLSRRLYLYTASNPSNPEVRPFIEFALGKQGQDVVADTGFVAQNVKTETYALPADSPAEYTRMTSGAHRLSLNFRFRTGSSDLDNKALVDLDRVVSFISDLHYSTSDVLLFGFADSTGSDDVNNRLSKDRARAVADQFDQRGLKPGLITGFGSHNPVASNDNEDGRQKNRRVEIWVKGKASE